MPRLCDDCAPDSTVAIVIADITRPSPSERLVPWIMAELAHVPRENFVIINGTGSHRANTREELVQMLGAEIVETVRIVNHNAFDDATLTASGPHQLRRRDLAEQRLPARRRADRHRLHRAALLRRLQRRAEGRSCRAWPASRRSCICITPQMIGDPRSTWARLEGNPVQGEIREAVAMAPPHFMVNVAINAAPRRSPAVWAGHYIDGARGGCRFVAEHATRPVDEPFDIVITTNSGYPLDQNLYQAVKGMSAAARIVRPGGAIVAVAECSDGLPDHGNFKQLLQMRQHAARTAGR